MEIIWRSSLLNDNVLIISVKDNIWHLNRKLDDVYLLPFQSVQPNNGHVSIYRYFNEDRNFFIGILSSEFFP